MPLVESKKLLDRSVAVQAASWSVFWKKKRLFPGLLIGHDCAVCIPLFDFPVKTYNY